MTSLCFRILQHANRRNAPQRSVRSHAFYDACPYACLLLINHLAEISSRITTPHYPLLLTTSSRFRSRFSPATFPLLLLFSSFLYCISINVKSLRREGLCIVRSQSARLGNVIFTCLDIPDPDFAVRWPFVRNGLSVGDRLSGLRCISTPSDHI